MGRKIVLTGTTLTDLSAPKLASLDPIESAGSLFLLEPAHPALQWAAGVPANGATLPNLFEANADSVVGVADHGALVTHDLTDAAIIRAERTGKGGLHAYVSAANGIPSPKGIRIRYGDALSEHMRTSGHAFYFSLWVRMTRTRTDTDGLRQGPVLIFANSSADSNNYLARLSTNQGNRPVTGMSLGYHLEDFQTAGPYAVGNKRLSLGAGGWVGTVPTAIASLQRNAFRVGSPSGATSNPTGPGAPSYILYRQYIEDLTVSGRTYAQVDAIDAAAYAAAFGTGGRYAGDTYTDPSTLA